ncbi:hypothetical protein PAMP_001693 [Pampus punctatissimus]
MPSCHQLVTRRQLMENHITVIERGAFDDMKELERLRLNRNQLQQLPELLFQKNPALSRLSHYYSSDYLEHLGIMKQWDMEKSFPSLLST